MDSESGDQPTFEDLTDAFVHPPQLIAVGYRHRSEDGQVVVVSHVEIWPWRVVVVGCRTRTQLELDELRPKFARPTAPPPDLGPGAPGAFVGAVQFTVDEGHEDWRAQIERDIAWYDSWRISDDADTNYWFVGSPRREQQRIEDFAIERHPAPPANATALNIETPFGDTIRLRLDG